MNPSRLFLAACWAVFAAFLLGITALWPLKASAQPPRAAEFGTYQGSGCTGRPRIATFERWAGRKVDRVLDGLTYDSWESFVKSAGWITSCWDKSGYKLVLTMPMLMKDGKSTLRAGADGEYDKHFLRVAQTLVDKGYGDAIVRIGQEFNAPWFPWSSLKEPEVWAAYWRRIVDTMRSVPGQKFRFDWSAAVGPGAKSPEPAYPGDDYVDIIGADVYNANFQPKKFTREDIWSMTLNAKYGLKWHQRFAAEHGKPMSFPEWGTGTRPDGFGGGDDPDFIRKMADWIDDNNVVYQIYWDYPASDFNGRLSDGSKPQAAEKFLERFGRSR